MRIKAIIAAGALAGLTMAAPARADDAVPTGTLRATYIATNPVQAFVNPTTGETRGPGADIARGLAKRLGVAVTITGVAGPAGVIDSIKKGEADIGFLAFDPQRAKEVDFSQPYAPAQNSIIVPENSRLKSVAAIDRPGVPIGVTARDAGDLYLSRTLKAAEIRRNGTGGLDVVIPWLADRNVDAYGTNRQRLTEIATRNPGYRVLPDNFYGVEQSVVVAKGKAALLDAANSFIEEARVSGFTARAIADAGLVGVDVAPAPAK